MSIWSESTIKDNEPRNQYTASGGQTVFPYTFIIFDEDDLTVERTRDGTTTTLTRTTDYTVDSVGEEDGGDVTLTSGANADDTITIYRDLPVRRLTDFAVPGDYNPDTLNEELDKQIAMLQEQEVTVNRTIRLSPNDERSGDDFELPLQDERANKILSFDENGDIVLSVSEATISEIDSIEAFTSGNRPSANNDKILGIETDTGRVIYDNGSWVEVGLSEDQIDLSNLNSLDAGNQKITGVNDPGGTAKAAVNLQTLNSQIEGLSPKPAARAATDGTNIDLTSSSDPNPIDGVTLTDGDDVLLKDQTDGSENGLYTAVTATDPTTWTRTEEMDEDSEVRGGEHVFILEGTANADRGFYVTSDNPTLGTDNIVWEQFMALGQVTAGDGLTKTGDQLDINVSDFAGSGLQDDGSGDLELTENSVTVAGKTVALGGSTGIAIFDLDNTDATALLLGTSGNRPSAGTADRLYVETDTQRIVRDNGSSWDVVGTTNIADTDHSASDHENGGSLEISVAGLSGSLADRQDADQLQGRDVQNVSPSDDEVLQWNDAESRWEPSTGDIDGSGDLTYVTTDDETTDLPNSTQHPNLSGADLHDPKSHDHQGETLNAGQYNIGGSTIAQSVAASGEVTLSSGTAVVDTGITATDATFMPAVGVDDPGADTKITARLFWDDSDGSYWIEFVEDGTSVGNPTCNYDIIRVR